MHNEAAAARPDRPRSTNSDESPTSLAVTHHSVRSIDELAMPQVIFTASLKAAIWGLTLRAAHGMVSLKLPVQSQLPQRLSLARPRQLIVRLAHATGSLIRHASRLRHLHFRLVCGHVVSPIGQTGGNVHSRVPKDMTLGFQMGTSRASTYRKLRSHGCSPLSPSAGDNTTQHSAALDLHDHAATSAASPECPSASL